MRIRAVVVVVALLPVGLSAQRIPLPGSVVFRGPARPAELPPQPAPIANELAYRRLRLSVESYPLVSLVQAPGSNGIGPISTWTTFGMGTRADYRLTRFASATLDITSSFLGGPAITQTTEVGTRLGPQRSDRKLYPFVDARVGYISSYSRALGTVDVNGYPVPEGYSSRYSRGFGAIGGAGLEYAFTRMFSLTSALSVVRSRMSARDFRVEQTVNRAYTLTAYRYTLGLRFNPVRSIPAPDTR